MPSALRRWLVVFMVVLGGLLGAALPASAHALLERSDPEDGVALDRPPAAVTLDFSESVSITPTSVRVIDASGTRVDAGDVHHGSVGSRVVVGLRAGLGTGTYVVTWHVTSADSHPISGAFSFGVGAAPNAAAAPVPGQRGSRIVGELAGTARFVQFAGLVVFVGGGFFLVALWPAGLRRRMPRRLLWVGWGTAFGGAAALLLLQGPYGSGLPLSAVTRWDTLSATLHDRYGHLVLLRMLLLGLAVPALRGLRPHPGSKKHGSFSRVDLGMLAVGVLLTQAAVGHAGVGSNSWLAVASTTVHLAGVSVWVGGLAMLATFVLRPAHARQLAGVLPRWSKIAMAAVAAIVISGGYQSWRQVGTLGALGGTTYGRLLVVKLCLVGVLLGLGWLGNRWVVRHYRPVVHAMIDTALPTVSEPAEPPAAQISQLRRSVTAEVALGAVVLVVTTLLVNAAPARSAYAPPFIQTVQAGPVTVGVDVSPTRRGPQTMHVYTFDSRGQIQPVAEISGQLSLPSQGIAPAAVPFQPTGPGHATAAGVPVPLPGRWQLRLTVRIDQLNDYVTTLFYRVR